MLALDEHLRKSRIDPADKRLATSIFYTALENRLKIAHALKQFVERMPDREVECVLHIAAAQLILMNKIPDYAAVDAAAEQARALNRESYVALVNGAARSLIRARDAGEIRWPDRSDPLTYLSVMHSLPVFLAARLIRITASRRRSASSPTARRCVPKPSGPTSRGWMAAPSKPTGASTAGTWKWRPPRTRGVFSAPAT
jgi:hypothetical protein